MRKKRSMSWFDDHEYNDLSFRRDSTLQPLVLRRVKMMNGLLWTMFPTLLLAGLFGLLHHLLLLTVGMGLFAVCLVTGLFLMFRARSIFRCTQCRQRMRKVFVGRHLFQVCDQCKSFVYTYSQSGVATPV